MENEFIPYEQALALKELGFNEPCLKCYDISILLKNGEYYLDDWYNVGLNGIKAPLYQQSFRWFREKYKLHNGIYPYYDEYEYQIKDFRLPTNTPINGGLMKYEEAELACLIKLIEIVKTK